MRFRWWMAPVVGVGIVATANAVLILTAVRVRPQKVEAHPYAASAHEDARAAERAAFAERGWKLRSTVDGAGATLTLETAGAVSPVAGVVRLYRPDDVASDCEVAWADPAAPLRCPLPRPGAWELRLTLRDAAGVIIAHEERLNRP